MFEAMMDALIAFARAGAKGPTEILLPTREYLWLAADLDVNDPSAIPRIAYDPQPLAFSEATPSDKFRLRSVRVGSSFVFSGPLGDPVTIKEDTR